MFGAWLTATEEEIADALRAVRTNDDPDYTIGDSEDATAADAYEAAGRPVEQLAPHHTQS
mgnify:CR=1 FL=1